MSMAQLARLRTLDVMLAVTSYQAALLYFILYTNSGGINLYQMPIFQLRLCDQVCHE